MQPLLLSSGQAAVQWPSAWQTCALPSPVSQPCAAVIAAGRAMGSAMVQGVSASAVGAVPYSALRFGAFDGLKHLYRQAGHR